MPSGVEHGKSFITSGPDLDLQYFKTWYGILKKLLLYSYNTEVQMYQYLLSPLRLAIFSMQFVDKDSHLKKRDTSHSLKNIIRNERGFKDFFHNLTGNTLISSTYEKCVFQCCLVGTMYRHTNI